jgi:cytochrome c oxidase assembly factor CtaG
MSFLSGWSFDAGVVVPLVTIAVFYWLGVSNLWEYKRGRGIRVWEAACFWAGWTALTLALISPLHTLGEVLFTIHMIQHEILMLVAAPLMVLGKPGFAMLKAFPQSIASNLSAAANAGPLERAWSVAFSPLGAWLIHAAALWFWHIPAAFEAALHSEVAHAAQHLSFFLSAVLFWWSVMHTRARRLSYGLGVLYMFTTAMHSGLLGALLTFSRRIWYPSYGNSAFGFSPLADQQLGGLIMWVPAGIVYVIAGLAFFAGWLREGELRAERSVAAA